MTSYHKYLSQKIDQILVLKGNTEKKKPSA